MENQEPLNESRCSPLTSDDLLAAPRVGETLDFLSNGQVVTYQIERISDSILYLISLDLRYKAVSNSTEWIRERRKQRSG